MARARTPLAISQLIPGSRCLSLNAPYALPWKGSAGWAVGLAGENSASARSHALAAPNEAYFAHSVGEPHWDDPEDAFRLSASADAFPMTGFEVDCSSDAPRWDESGSDGLHFPAPR